MKLQEMTVHQMFDYSKEQGDKVYKHINNEVIKFNNGNGLDENVMNRLMKLGKAYKHNYMSALNNHVQVKYNVKEMMQIVRKLVEIRKEIVFVIKGE